MTHGRYAAVAAYGFDDMAWEIIAAVDAMRTISDRHFTC